MYIHNDRTGLRWWKANIDTALAVWCPRLVIVQFLCCISRLHSSQGLQTSAAWPQWLVVTIASSIRGSNSDLTISALSPASRSRYQSHSYLVRLYNCTSTSSEECIQTYECNHFQNTDSSWPRCVLELVAANSGSLKEYLHSTNHRWIMSSLENVMRKNSKEGLNICNPCMIKTYNSDIISAVYQYSVISSPEILLKSICILFSVLRKIERWHVTFPVMNGSYFR